MLPRRNTPCRPAFTLIELLIVVGIIGILMAIGLMVGNRVRSGGQDRLTQDIIRALDSAVVEYEAVKSELPPSRLTVGSGAGRVEYPIIDGRRDGAGYDQVNDPPTGSIARFTAAIAAVPQAQAALTAIASRGAAGKSYAKRAVIEENVTVDGKKTDVEGQEILDAWGRPIRAVAPGYDGGWGKYFDGASMKTRDNLLVSYKSSAGQVTDQAYRRSFRPFNPANATGQPIGDADEGICPSRRIYFYSAGEDGDPGTRENNVYTTVPQFPKETATGS